MPDPRPADRAPKSWHRLLRAAPLLGVALLLGGCDPTQWPVLNPDGPIAHEERELLYTAFGLMLIVVIPVYVLGIFVLLKYRASKNNPDYRPDWESNKVDAVVWLGPAIIVVALGTIVWDYTHRLDPYLPIPSTQPPIQIEAVAQDWKWLFIYPDEQIAVVNEVVIPAERAVSFRITSDTVMNSLYIPGLAGQIFAMAGMQTRLNLQADRPDTYVGRNTQYSGTGFADQQFPVKVVSEEEYAAWLETVRQSDKTLDADAYKELAKPTEKAPVTYYSSAEPGLFDTIIEKYMGPMDARHRAQLNAYAGEFICGPSDKGKL
jgi:cytochrome o ubiquinol oxidase subunit II